MTERTNRTSARIVVVDEAGCVLLIRIVDPLDPNPPVWITPGGGVEPGEALVDAACRELREETGMRVDVDALGAPVAVCRGDWEFRGRPFFSEDWYFALLVRRFDPSDEWLTELERELHDAWRWWTAEEIEATDEVVFPARLASVVRATAQGARPSQPIELPWTVAGDYAPGDTRPD